MGIISRIKGWWDRMFAADAEKAFGVTISTDTIMDVEIRRWINTYKGHPDWVNPDDGIKTIKFAKAVCSETARLTTLALDVAFDGGARADWLKQQFDNVIMPQLRNWCEFGCAAGTVILKPTTAGVSMYLPGQFIVVNSSNRRITDVIFQDVDTKKSAVRTEYYTKLERHSFENMSIRMNENEKYRDVVYYHVQNKAFLSMSENSIGKEVPLTETKWADLQSDTYITKQSDERIDAMLFGVFRMPAANDIEFDSPLGVAMFSDAMEELKDLDIAYSRNSDEVYDSLSIELLADPLLNAPGTKLSKRTNGGLPRHVHNVTGAIKDDFYQAIDRPLKTDLRITGINNQLSLIGYKCGYSNGYFVFDQKTGMVTATQVESDDRRTIQLIKDIRDSLENCLKDVFYAQSVFADLYDLVPVGDYEVNFSFGDITYNFEEDKQHHYNLASQGKYPWEEYYVEYLKYSREDAQKLLAMAKKENKDEGMFEEEE